MITIIQDGGCCPETSPGNDPNQGCATPCPHKHDDRYYTKPMIDRMFADLQKVNGSQVLFGTVPPLPATGNSGDVYIVFNQDRDIYKKYDDNWILQGKLHPDVDLTNYYTKSEIDALLVGLGGNLQQVTTGEGNNITSNAIHITGSGQYDATKDGMALLGGSGMGVLAILKGGVPVSHITFLPSSLTLAYTSGSGFVFKEETPTEASVHSSGRMSGAPAINSNEYVTKAQLDSIPGGGSTLQAVTTAEGSNKTSSAIQVTGMENLDVSEDGGALISTEGTTAIVNVKDLALKTGIQLGENFINTSSDNFYLDADFRTPIPRFALEGKNLYIGVKETVADNTLGIDNVNIKASNTVAIGIITPAGLSAGLAIREQTATDAGMFVNGRVQGQAGINPNDFVTKSQLDAGSGGITNYVKSDGETVVTNNFKITTVGGYSLTLESTNAIIRYGNNGDNEVVIGREFIAGRSGGANNYEINKTELKVYPGGGRYAVISAPASGNSSVVLPSNDTDGLVVALSVNGVAAGINGNIVLPMPPAAPMKLDMQSMVDLRSTNYSTTHCNLFGNNAGTNSAGSSFTNFFGNSSGFGAVNSRYSNFFGNNAGYDNRDSSFSNFFGGNAGAESSNANDSNFFGYYAGSQAPGAARSNFFGTSVGEKAMKASFSNLFGWQVGKAASTADSIGRNNIIIGTNITLAPNTQDSINIGGLLFGTGTFFNDVSTTPSTSIAANGKIGIGVIPTTSKFEVAGDVEIVSANSGVIVKSPDNSRWRVTVSDTGTVSATKL